MEVSFEDFRVRKSSYAQNLEDLTTRLYLFKHTAKFVENQFVNFSRTAHPYPCGTILIKHG